MINLHGPSSHRKAVAGEGLRDMAPPAARLSARRSREPARGRLYLACRHLQPAANLQAAAAAAGDDALRSSPRGHTLLGADDRTEAAAGSDEWRTATSTAQRPPLPPAGPLSVVAASGALPYSKAFTASIVEQFVRHNPILHIHLPSALTLPRPSDRRP